MSTWKLLVQSLRHYILHHLGVALAVAMGTAVVVAALVAGASFEASLADFAHQRIGAVSHGVHRVGGPFEPALAQRLSAALGRPAAPLVLLDASASTPDDLRRLGDVRLAGIDEAFGAVTGWTDLNPPLPGEVLINEALAKGLRISVGDSLVLRVARSDGPSPGAPLARKSLGVAPLVLKIAAVVPGAGGGNFDIFASQGSTPLAYVSSSFLAERLSKQIGANWILVAGAEELTEEDLASAARTQLHPEDIGLQVQRLEDGEWAISSPQVFIPDELVPALRQAGIEPLQILAYLATELKIGEKTIPYSMVAGLAGPEDRYPELKGLGGGGVLLNEWTADKLQAAPGARLEMSFFEYRPGGRQATGQASFTVNGILPMAGLGADPKLMPPFPGLHDAATCDSWDAGVDLDLSLIGPDDEAYWNQYRGAPKAIIAITGAKRYWATSSGSLTGLRLPAEVTREQLELALAEGLPAATTGISVMPLAEQAHLAVAQAMDMSGLMLGFGFFLIAAAFLLAVGGTALAVQARGREVGTLTALGWPPQRILRFRLAEMSMVVALSAVPGVLLGLALAWWMVSIVGKAWAPPGESSSLMLTFPLVRIVLGALAGTALGLVLTGWVIFRQGMGNAMVLLAQRPVTTRPGRPGKLFLWAAISVILSGSGVAFIFFMEKLSVPRSIAFFGAGGILLLGFLAAANALLSGLSEERRPGGRFGWWNLLVRNLTFRRARTMTAISLLAIALFMVLAADAHRLSTPDAQDRASGTGGFAWIAQTTVPLFRAGPDEAGSIPTLTGPGSIVAMRLRPGDEASCRNLNRPQTPRIVGVPARDLAGLGAFQFAETWNDAPPGWGMLDERLPDGEIPAVADLNTITWSLGARVGDLIDVVDGFGETQHLRLVGALANSVMQGALLIGEWPFRRLFPKDVGYRLFLVDGTADGTGGREADLARRYRDYGWVAESTTDRLAQFMAVQNTYLSAFQLLGALALVLGAAGFGIIVLRNSWERQSDLALLAGIGISPSRSRRWLVAEHLVMLAGSFLCGVVPSAIALAPILRQGSGSVAWGGLLLTMTSSLVAGIIATLVAAHWGHRDMIITSLRRNA